jgi:TonB family protein
MNASIRAAAGVVTSLVLIVPVMTAAQGRELQREPGPLEMRANPITPENPVPRRLFGQAPYYPPEAAGSGAHGAVMLRITVDESGRVAEVRTTAGMRSYGFDAGAGDDVFANSAAAAVRLWQYEPPVNGPIAFNVSFRFTPDADATLTSHGTATARTIGSAPGMMAPVGRVPNPDVFPRRSRPFGKTYEEWTVAYRQWLAAIPAASNPGVDLTGEFCGEGQSGPVWFLASHIGGPAAVERECHMPAGKALYVPLVGFIAWAPEDVGRASAVLQGFLGLDPSTMTDEEIIRVGVNWFIDLVTDLSITVNGVAYGDLFSYRAETPVFHFVGTDLYDDIGLPVSESSQVIADGFALILPPLPPGSYTIEIHAASRDHPIVEFGDAVFDITYHLTVGP